MKKITFAMLFSLALNACTTARPIAATSNTLGSDKGVACAINILGFIPLETDATIYKAASKGNITKITTVDYEGFYSGFYNKECTVVRGTR